jgi:hypothetical protein
MKHLIALSVVLICSACARSNSSGPQPAPAQPQADKVTVTALDAFFGDYETVVQNDSDVVGTYESDTALTCDTLTQIGKATMHRKTDTEDAVFYADGFTDPATGAVVKANEIWVAPGVVMFDSGAACTDYPMMIFADRGQWRYGDTFVEYSFQGDLLNGTKTESFDDYLRIDKLENGQLKVTMSSEGTNAQFGGTFVLQPK